MTDITPAFFFDTANVEYISTAWQKISHLMPASAVRGITTNPNAMHKENIESIEAMKQQVEKLCRFMSQIRPDGKGVVYVQQPNSEMDSEKLKEWAKFLTTLGDGKTPIAMKIAPFTSTLEVGRELSKMIEINVTGVADCSTALRAFTYGVRYVSIIPGRMEEIGIDAKSQVDFVQQRQPDEGEIITGSMRTIDGLKWVCQAGTIPTIGTRVWDIIFSDNRLDELPLLWANAATVPEIKFSPPIASKQINLSIQFFEQMDELGMGIYKEFIS